jgi:hypothetical protein
MRRVSDEKILRLLEVARRQLDADDARVEIGGHAPESEHELWAPVGHGHRRLVVFFDKPPADRETVQQRLALLAEAFVDIAVSDIGEPEPVMHGTGALDDELAGLCERTNAAAAAVIDSSSPVVWGASHPELRGNGAVDRLLRVSTALERAGTPKIAEATTALRERNHPDATLLERVAEELGQREEALHRYELCARAVLLVRQRLAKAPSLAGSLRQMVRDDGLHLFARGLGGVYALVLAFDEPFSEPRVEGSVRRALHHFERLIAALPPIEPPPRGGARVLSLRRPR